MAASWHSRSTPARPDQKHHRVLLHGPSAVVCGAPCYPTNPARRCSMPPAPCTLAAAGAHDIVHFHSQPSRHPRGICKGSDGCWMGSQLGVRSKSGGSEGASCGCKTGAAGRSRRKGLPARPCLLVEGCPDLPKLTPPSLWSWRLKPHVCFAP